MNERLMTLFVNTALRIDEWEADDESVESVFGNRRM